MKGALVLFLAMSSSAFAAPGEFVLSSPTRVVKGSGWMDVYYTARCSESDWASVVSAYDDTGDQMMVIGVAVPMDSRSCRPSRRFHEFRTRVHKGETAYEAMTGEYEPMSVRGCNR